jgi:hypothetical protein
VAAVVQSSGDKSSRSVASIALTRLLSMNARCGRKPLWLGCDTEVGGQVSSDWTCNSSLLSVVRLPLFV